MQKEKNTIEQYSFVDSEKVFIMRPLEHKGFNKHYINLINADVFNTHKKSLFDSLKEFFSSLK